jgi:hypothetical protein
MPAAPSDWEEGVLAAATWLRHRASPDELSRIDQMLREIKQPDTEGTEARTVRQIVRFIRDHRDAGHDTAHMAVAIEAGDWKQP